MFRNLKAIEIAEGALLADVAVIFHLLTLYLPVGGDFFRSLTFVVFAVLVLRRDLYVGIMGLCTAFFIVGVVTGLHGMSLMLLEGTGGLFLGAAMKYRLRHIPLILLGTTCGALALYFMLFFFTLLAGQPLDIFILSLHRTYNSLMALANLIAANVGLGMWWKHNIVPTISSLATLGFTYWWATTYLGAWLVLCPIVTIIYALTNQFARLLGYDVRPFFGGRVSKMLQRARRRLVRVGIRRGIIRRAEAKA